MTDPARKPVRVADPIPGRRRRKVLEAMDTGTLASPGATLVRVAIFGGHGALHGGIFLPETALREFCRRVLEEYPEPSGGDAAREARQSEVARSSLQRCITPMTHPDRTVGRCILHKDHVLDDTDHRDEHGCTAPVLVHQASIRQAQAVRDARARGDIE